MVLENRVLTKCSGISKHHTMRPADDLSRTDGDSSGKVPETLDSDRSRAVKRSADSPERRATGQVAELVDANTCGKYAEQGEQH